MLALSDDAGPDNLDRYLAVSRALEESRPTGLARATPRLGRTRRARVRPASA
jgi:hypothetical protein